MKFMYYLLLSRVNVKISLLIITFSLFGINHSKATHATGADLTYQHLANGKYRVTFTLYRDCFGIDAPTSQMLHYSSVSSNFTNQVLMFRLPGTGVEITRTCSTAVSTCQGGSVAGIQEWKYSADVTLPSLCADWQFYTSVTNRNAAITTIVDPDGEALYVEAFLNNIISENNSPTFSNVPIAFECIGQTNNFNQGVIDIDGDSLVYSFITPRSNGNSKLIYQPGYSVANPIKSSPPVSINSINGDITMNPTQQDIASVAVLVREFRNGIIIGSVMRDMQLYIVACTNTLPVITGINGTQNFSISTCVGRQICFDVTSNDLDAGQALTMSWNQGIPGATFGITGSIHPVGHFCWSPTPSDGRVQPYTFSVTIRDNACPSNGVQTFSYSISISNLGIQLTSTPSIQCYGSHNGSASAIASGNPPLQYIWTLPNGRFLTTRYISHLKGGNYILNVIDGNGCYGTKYFTIAEPPALQVSLNTTNGDCINNTGSILANVSGGSPVYNYLWSPGGQTTPNVRNLSSDTYTLKVTDNNGCTSRASTNVQSITPVSFELILNGATCSANDGSATVTHSGGTGNFSYQWTPDIPGNTTSSSITGLITGEYSVIATDLGTGCSQTLSGIVQNLTGITATITNSSNAKCESGEDGSASVQASGGEAPYFYLWPNGDNTYTTNHLETGPQLVMVEDYNGCRAFARVTIGFDNPSPSIDLGHDTMPRIGLPFLIDAGPGFNSYLWNNGTTNSSILVTTSGTYSVLVKNSYGCQSFDAIKVTFVNGSSNNEEHASNLNTVVNIYPNPTNSEININVSRIRNTDVILTMTDIIGNNIFISKESATYGYSKKVDMQSFPAGIYLMKVQYNDEINTIRVIKK